VSAGASNSDRSAAIEAGGEGSSISTQQQSRGERVPLHRRFGNMHPAKYYREQARHARLLANRAPPGAVRDTLFKAAQNFDDIAEDLEAGAIEVRHPELMPQRRG
jgi:hypothetical protein